MLLRDVPADAQPAALAQPCDQLGQLRALDARAAVPHTQAHVARAGAPRADLDHPSARCGADRIGDQVVEQARQHLLVGADLDRPRWMRRGQRDSLRARAGQSALDGGIEQGAEIDAHRLHQRVLAARALEDPLGNLQRPLGLPQHGLRRRP